MNLIAKLVTSINGILWDYILIYALVGIGLFFTIYLGAPQIMQFSAGFKSVFGGLFNKNKGEKDHQALSQFQALAVAISAQIGTGNVAGVATAITAGGAGAIFWMWLSAFFGMSTIFAEAILAQKYRVVSHGKYIGGPAFYITHGLSDKLGRGTARFLSGFFSIALIIALGFIGNAVQANSIAGAVSSAFSIPPIAVGIVIAIAAGKPYWAVQQVLACAKPFVMAWREACFPTKLAWVLRHTPTQPPMSPTQLCKAWQRSSAFLLTRFWCVPPPHW